MTQTFYLIRHFEVEAHYKDTYIGWTDAHLSPEGIRTASECKNELQEILKSCEQFYSSDLSRCKQSLSCLGIDEPRITCLEGLREKSFGKSEGMSFELIQKVHNIAYRDFLQWIEAIGGESVEDFLARIRHTLFEQVFSSAKEANLIMTHAGVIHAMESIVKNVPLEEVFADKLHYGDIRKFTRTGESLRWIEG